MLSLAKCNNPLTKEPKLNQATRIIGQRWTDLDVLGRTLAEAGLDSAHWATLAQDQAVKDNLKATTEEAVERGVFGAQPPPLARQGLAGEETAGLQVFGGGHGGASL